MFRRLELDSLSVIYIVSCLDLFAVGLTFPLFGAHLKQLGASHFTIGLLSSTYAGVQVLSGPLIGSWSDVRDRKTVLKFTLFSCFILYGSLGIPTSILLIFLIRFLLGIVKHTQTLTKAIITDVTTKENNGNAFGKSTAYGNLGFILGPFIGGYLSEFDDGFFYVSMLSSVLFLINLVICLKLPQGKPKGQKSASILKGVNQEFRKTLIELRDLDWKQHWLSFTLRFLFGLSTSAYFGNQALYLQEKYGLSQKHIGYTISFHGIVGIFAAFYLNLVNKWYKNDRLGYKRLYHFFALATLCYISVYLSPNVYTFVLTLLPLALSNTVLRVTSLDLMLQKGTKGQRGSLSGASNSVMSIARFVQPLLSGLMGEFLGQQSVIFLAVLPTLVGTAICYCYVYNSKRTIKNQ